MPALSFPPEYTESRPSKPDELMAVTAPSHGAIKTLERCIASHHVVAIDYTDRNGHHSTIRMQPISIRTNSTKHVVLWGIALDDGDLEGLWLERMSDVRDTGEEFTPSW
jgi:predicted DNA-binding transcriptional regulator YafY